MNEKQKILIIINEIIIQINKILNLGLDTQEKRNESNITVFSPKCPMCVEYICDNICDRNCPLSNQKQYGCLNSCTKPKNNFNEYELKFRLKFWEELLSVLKDEDDSLFTIENRINLQELIIKIDKSNGK